MAWPVAGCEKELPKYRYRLTVVVRTPQGKRTGSAVREVGAYSEPHFLPEMASIVSEFKGEAVIIDLPGGKTLFAVLNAPTVEGEPNQVGWEVFKDHFHRRADSYVSMAQFLSRTKLKRDLPRSWFPNFVAFRDPTKPATVSLVQPDRPEQTLGEGVQVQSVIFETTDDPVTSVIDGRLPWLRDWHTTLGGQPFKNDDSAANSLARKDFIQP